MRLMFIAFIVIAQSVSMSVSAKSIFDKGEVMHERWKLEQNLNHGKRYTVECVMEQRGNTAFCLVHEPEHPELCPSRGIGNFDEDGDWSECDPEMRNGVKTCAEHDLTTCPILATWTPPIETVASNRDAEANDSNGENPLTKIFGMMTGKSSGKLFGAKSSARTGSPSNTTTGLSLPCKARYHQGCGVIIEGSVPGVGKTLVEVGEVNGHTSYAYVDLNNP